MNECSLMDVKTEELINILCSEKGYYDTFFTMSIMTVDCGKQLSYIRSSVVDVQHRLVIKIEVTVQNYLPHATDDNIIAPH